MSARVPPFETQICDERDLQAPDHTPLIFGNNDEVVRVGIDVTRTRVHMRSSDPSPLSRVAPSGSSNNNATIAGEVVFPHEPL